MANYSQDGITFSNVKDGGKVQSSSPIWTGQVGVDEFGGIVNAVDIDWNGARLLDSTNKITPLNTFNPYAPNAYINTTGEFCLKRCS